MKKIKKSDKKKIEEFLSENMYENTYIGNFIFMLGIETGRRYFSKEKSEQTKNTSINLYQQTPLDPKLSDILAKWNGKFFLLEFKRDKKEISREKLKKDKILFISNLKSHEDLSKLSQRCHFMAFPHPQFATSREIMFFLPYLTAVESDSLSKEHTFCLPNFYHKIFSEPPILGLEKEEFKIYLNSMKFNSFEKMEGIVFSFEEGKPFNMHHFKNWKQFSADTNFLESDFPALIARGNLENISNLMLGYEGEKEQ